MTSPRHNPIAHRDIEDVILIQFILVQIPAEVSRDPGLAVMVLAWLHADSHGKLREFDLEDVVAMFNKLQNKSNSPTVLVIHEMMKHGTLIVQSLRNLL